MSYILDALKRADAERERGVVPGLHTPQVTNARRSAPPSPSRTLWPIVAAALVVAAIAAGLWAWRTARDVPARPAPESAVVEVAPSAAPTTQALPAPTAAPAPQPAMPPLAASVPPSSASAPATAAHTTVKAKTSPPVAPPVVPGLSTSRTSSAEVPMLAELPEELRRNIPVLTITGAVYSENPAQRLLVVNNRVLNQDSQAAPEVRLEEIGSDSSVFSFRGTRFRLAH